VMSGRKIEEKIFVALMIASTAGFLCMLVLIMVLITVRGAPALNWAMITQVPKGGFYLGKEGGIANAVVGSLLLAGGASILALMVSIPLVLYLNVYAKKQSSVTTITRFCLDVLWGVPSIVYGAFGFALMMLFGLQASLLGGIIAIALLMLPIMSRAMDEVVRMVPAELLEASYALGSTRLETALKIVVRQTLPAVMTAILIAFGRGIGDAAAVIFTAGYTDAMPYSLFRPVATLPLAIFFQLGTPIAAVQNRAYAAAFILTVLILLISLACRALTRRYAKHVVK
jgi:phosphate transport system permease protein